MFESPVIFIIFYVGGGLDLDFVCEGILCGYSIVWSVVAFWGRDDPSPFEQLGSDDSFSDRPELFI